MIGTLVIFALVASDPAAPVVHESTGTWKECIWKADPDAARRMAEATYQGRFSTSQCPLDPEIEIKANRPRLIRIMAETVAAKDRERRDAALANCLVADAKSRQALIALFAEPTSAESAAAREKLKQDKFEVTPAGVTQVAIMQRPMPPGIAAAAGRCDTETWVAWNKWGRAMLLQQLAPLVDRAKAGGV